MMDINIMAAHAIPVWSIPTIVVDIITTFYGAACSMVMAIIILTIMGMDTIMHREVSNRRYIPFPVRCRQQEVWSDRIVLSPVVALVHPAMDSALVLKDNTRQ